MHPLTRRNTTAHRHTATPQRISTQHTPAHRHTAPPSASAQQHHGASASPWPSLLACSTVRPAGVLPKSLPTSLQGGYKQANGSEVLQLGRQMHCQSPCPFPCGLRSTRAGSNLACLTPAPSYSNHRAASRDTDPEHSSPVYRLHHVLPPCRKLGCHRGRLCRAEARHLGAIWHARRRRLAAFHKRHLLPAGNGVLMDFRPFC